jgi:hypothetical protein
MYYAHGKSLSARRLPDEKVPSPEALAISSGTVTSRIKKVASGIKKASNCGHSMQVKNRYMIYPHENTRFCLKEVFAKPV